MEATCRKRKLAAMLTIKELMDDDWEEELILTAIFRKEVSGLFQNRVNEGMFDILIRNHFHDEEEKFHDYFQLTRERFSFVLSLVTSIIFRIFFYSHKFEN